MVDEPAGFVVAVVDDDQSVLDSIGLLMESADYKVRLFTSGTALLQSSCLREIDCLISDIDMPGMDGFELLREIHAARPALPTILITGYPDRLKRLPRLYAGKTRFFTKPLQGPELLTAVSESLGDAPG
jgi:FixJ family two-component response regulator